MYYCYNCKSEYTEAEITFNGYLSRWCPLCFKLGESPFDCELEELDHGL